MESSESFRTAACSMQANGTAPVHSEKEHEQGGLFQVNICRRKLSNHSAAQRLGSFIFHPVA